MTASNSADPAETGGITAEPTRSILARFARDVVLLTGRVVQIRPAEPADLEGLRAFYSSLSHTSNYYRFFGARLWIPDDELRRATVHDVHRAVTLLAKSRGDIIGVGEYHVSGDDGEVAFAVADAHHGEGVATLLLEDLATIGRAAGLRRLVAETLPDNDPMKRVFRSIGLVHRTWFEDGVVRVELDLGSERLLQDDSDLRDWRAAVRSLQPIVDPGHVVVIGTDAGAPDVRSSVLRNLAGAFTGTVTALDPTELDAALAELVDDAAGGPQLAIITVPAHQVTDVVERCGSAGVRVAVVTAPGFAETGEVGRRLEADLLSVGRRHGMRLLGPNSLGVVSTRCGLNATTSRQEFAPGGIAVASQSGGVGLAIAAEIHRRNAGVSSFVSMGNKADVSGNDLLRLWVEDPDTTVALLYLESFGDPIRFARVARAVSRSKPIVALKSAGPMASSSVGSDLGPAREDEIVDALMTHTGVLRARTLDELVDAGLLLDEFPAPGGPRIALVGNSHGPLALAEDAAHGTSLVVPAFSEGLQRALAALAPAPAVTRNPVDLGPEVSAERLSAVVRTIGSSGEVDACVVTWVESRDAGDRRRRPGFGALRRSGIPVAVSLSGGAGRRRSGGLATFPSPERAVAAVALAARRASWLAAIAAEDVEGETVVDPAAFTEPRRVARREIGEREGAIWLESHDAAELLSAAGLPLVADGVEGAWMPRMPGSLELLVAAMRDVTYGPFVVVGAGGPDNELRDDRVVLVAPASRQAVRQALEGLRLAPLFHGYRGRPSLAFDDAVAFVHRACAFVASVGEVQHLELDPVLVSPDSCLAVDARVRLSAVSEGAVPVRALRASQR
jgi:acyl-CoA synthetase (NDP forming)/GNAT superfamily N-acetyltransferase